MVVIILLAIANQDTFQLNHGIARSIASLLLIVSIYTFYSVIRYFGMDRAAGLDHFDLEVRELPFVREGIFKYTGNAMYSFAFLIIYYPGLIALSKAALLAAAFSHIYIWVHYYTTEQPDIKRMYGGLGE